MFNHLKSNIPLPLKKYFLSPIKRKVDKSIWSFYLAIFYLKRKVRIRQRIRLDAPISFSSYHFIILCIKKTIYADMVLTNINSLHYRNPTHHVTVQCDALCYEYLACKFKKFDYPSQVSLEKIAHTSEKGWQFFKVDAIINAAWNDRILFDADTFWHEDIVIDREKITMLTSCGTMEEDEKSEGVIMNVFKKPEWLYWQHNVAAFVSIPKKLITEKIAEDMRTFNQMVWDHPLDFIREEKRGEIRRLSEEYAVNLSIQNNYPQDILVVLKEKDGVKNRKKMESLYYGCKNEINE